MNHLSNPFSNHIPALNTITGRDQHWYVAYTYPRHEKAVREQLESKFIETFLPTFVSEKRWKDRRVRIQAPLFPGYVFTRIDLAERSKVLATPGVVRMLSSNGAPVRIDESEIEAVRRCLERGVTLEPYPFLAVGDRVRVKSGVLEGIVGLISRSKDDRRLIVPIGIINQSIAVEIDAQLLEPASTQNIIPNGYYSDHIATTHPPPSKFWTYKPLTVNATASTYEQLIARS
jgi:transcription antitermination factor NusG